MAVRPERPTKRPRVHTLMAPAFSAENKSYANAGEVTASVAKEVEATKAFSFTDSCGTWREGERGGKRVNNLESTERERERERERKKKGERRAHPHPHPSTEIRVRENQIAPAREEEQNCFARTMVSSETALILTCYCDARAESTTSESEGERERLSRFRTTMMISER